MRGLSIIEARKSPTPHARNVDAAAGYSSKLLTGDLRTMDIAGHFGMLREAHQPVRVFRFERGGAAKLGKRILAQVDAPVGHAVI